MQHPLPIAAQPSASFNDLVEERLAWLERVLKADPDISSRRAAAAEYLQLTEPVDSLMPQAS